MEVYTMLDKKMEQLLNEQMNFEFYSAHVYLAMAGFAAEAGLPGFQNWFEVQYEEEIFHARRFMQFIMAAGGRLDMQGFENPVNDYKSILDAFETTLHHEQEVSGRIHNIMVEAHKAHDYKTTSFLQWFIDEQVEEEENAMDIISKIKLVKDVGLYMLDKDMAGRTFTPPTI